MKRKKINRVRINVVSSSDKRIKGSVARIGFHKSLSNPFLRYPADLDGGTSSKVSLYMPQESKRIIKEKILDIIIEKNMRFSKEEKEEIKSLYANMEYTKLLRFLESFENKDNHSKD